MPWFRKTKIKIAIEVMEGSTNGRRPRMSQTPQFTSGMAKKYLDDNGHIDPNSAYYKHALDWAEKSGRPLVDIQREHRIEQQGKRGRR